MSGKNQSKSLLIAQLKAILNESDPALKDVKVPRRILQRVIYSLVHPQTEEK